MTVDHVVAVVAVIDFQTSHDSYRRLFDTPATNVPIAGLAEWRVTDTGWLQVFHDPDRGHEHGQLRRRRSVPVPRRTRARGIDTGEIVEANKGVRLCSVNDADNNTITFIESFP